MTLQHGLQQHTVLRTQQHGPQQQSQQGSQQEQQQGSQHELQHDLQHEPQPQPQPQPQSHPQPQPQPHPQPGILINSSVIACKLYFYASFLFAALSPTILILASIDRLLISSQNVDTPVINTILDILMIVLCVFAFKNVRRIRSIPREKRNQIRSMTKKDFQLLRCLFVQDVIYIIFGTSISIFYIFDAITKYENGIILEQAIRKFLYDSMTFIYSTSYSVNVFTFIIVSKAFRHELKRTIYKIIGKDLVPIREEENHERDNVEINVVSIIELPA
ncbi:unnamed protein product [Adineta steineri]|uniref:Uncharacterized protein n=1 Tax=Adineta steineri TaxID=433720 RepID=A0A819R9H9_9BILA|nr:unnamed protein product [Adineta steineri]